MERDEETVEVPETTRILSTVIEETSRRNSSRASPPLTYPESVFTRSSRLLPSMRNSTDRGGLTPPPIPMVRRASDPPSPPTSTARNSADGPWRDSMWSVGLTSLGGASPMNAYSSTSRSSTRLSHRASRSVNWESLQHFGTSNSWADMQGQPNGGLVDGGVGGRQGTGMAYSMAPDATAVPTIPSHFLSGTTGIPVIPSSMNDGRMKGERRDKSNMATVFKQHPGDLIQL